MKATTFSLIIPTRRRTHRLRRLLESLGATTRRPDELEVILVIDDDDQETIQFHFDGITVKRVLVPPGLTMGALNIAGYRSATGQYLMLLNDDVILQTLDWDEHVRAAFQSCSDGMVLVHVNDLVFRDTLCIFPVLTREFCLLAGGICPEYYLRYRIDDHIHNIFDLISLLGHHRRLFLPDVVFEHTNVETSKGGALHYVPDPAIHEIDTQLFHSLLDERKRVAMEAMSRIDGALPSEQYLIWKEELDSVSDSVAIRRPEHALWFTTAGSPPDSGLRVTIGIVSADLRSTYAQKCVDLIRLHTANYELILIDNNRDPNFNHSREMNRILSICRTDYLVLMDDDVFVEPGWLQGLLRCVGPKVGVVTPLHKDSLGDLSYAGIVMRPDDTGHHTHTLDAPAEPRRIQTLCSAIMLVHMPTCGHIRLDERYSKYFLDIDYGLQVWEHGFQVVCSPYSEVTHLAGATLEQGGPRGAPLFEQQRQRYFESWVSSGRIRALRKGVWKRIPEISSIAEMARKIDLLVEEGGRRDRDEFMRDSVALIETLAAYPALRNYVAVRAVAGIGEHAARVDDPKTGHLALLLGLSGDPILLEEAIEGLDIVEVSSIYCAFPHDEGDFSYERMIRGGYTRSFEANSLKDLKSLILRHTAVPVQGHIVGPRGPRPASPEHSVSPSRCNPLVHFLETGAHDGHKPNPLFDTAWYLQQNPDVAESGMNPLEHFLEVGAAKGCKPNPYFHPTYYLEQNPDVAATGMNPLAHFLERGASEGRRASPQFDTAAYLRRHPDLVKAGINPLAHFLQALSK